MSDNQKYDPNVEGIALNLIAQGIPKEKAWASAREYVLKNANQIRVMAHKALRASRPNAPISSSSFTGDPSKDFEQPDDHKEE